MEWRDSRSLLCLLNLLDQRIKEQRLSDRLWSTGFLLFYRAGDRIKGCDDMFTTPNMSTKLGPSLADKETMTRLLVFEHIALLTLTFLSTW